MFVYMNFPVDLPVHEVLIFWLHVVILLGGSIEVEIVERAVEMRNPLLILAVPGAGLVGVIAADHVIKSMGLKEIGKVDSPSFPPVIAIKDGVARDTIKIYGGDGVYVVKADVPLPITSLAQLTTAVLDWIAKKRPKLVMVIGGIPEEDRLKIQTPTVMKVYNSEEAKAAGEKIGGEFMRDGFLSGYAAFFLREASRRGVPAVAIIVQSFAVYPDPGAAAEALRAIEPLLGVKLDISKLEEESETIRLKLKELMSQTMKAMPKEELAASPMYIG